MNIIHENDFDIEISDVQCEFQDSIYLSSQYHVCYLLSNYESDQDICSPAVLIADNIINRVIRLIRRFVILHFIETFNTPEFNYS